MPTHTHTSVVTHIDPEISTQKMINDSTPPPAPCCVLTGAGAIINVVSSLDGTSSGSNSATFTVPQNSHCQVYSINQNFVHQRNIFRITLPWLLFQCSLSAWRGGTRWLYNLHCCTQQHPQCAYGWAQSVY